MNRGYNLNFFTNLSEDLKIEWLREFTDGAVRKIQKSEFTEMEAILFLENVKNVILQKFPDKEQQYEIIYGRRFKRLLSKKGICLELFADKITRN